MRDKEILEVWQNMNEKLEMSLKTNEVLGSEVSRLKVIHYLSSMKPLKIFALITGIIWVGAGTALLGNIYLESFAESNKFFLFSATIQVVLTGLALIIYVYQLALIYMVDLSESVLATQEKLARLKSSTLWATRILFLQFPVWTTFWWNETMLQTWSPLQWAVAGSFTIIFTILAIWLFFNIRFENRHKQWFIRLFSGQEWSPLMKSMDLLEQVENYKTGK